MLREIVVVEGKADTIAVKRALEAETIETGGSAVSEEVIRQVRLAHERRGVIVLTDPDYQGERIRHLLSRAVPGLKHAFISREEATRKGRVGVEYASPEAIRQALRGARAEEEREVPTLSWEAYVQSGLAGGPGSRLLRQRIGEVLGIGYANAQQMYKRLVRFHITNEEFSQALLAATGVMEGETGTKDREEISHADT